MEGSSSLFFHLKLLTNSNTVSHSCIYRFNDKVLIEQQINEARKGPAWDITRHHLKQAKAQLDRERSRQRRLVGNGQQHLDHDNDSRNSSRNFLAVTGLAAAERWRKFAASGSGSSKRRMAESSAGAGPDRLEVSGGRGLSVSLDLSRMSSGGGGVGGVPWLCNGGNTVDGCNDHLGKSVRSAGGRYVTSGSTRSDETLHI